MSLAEIKYELVRSEYPHLSPEHDPDVERYYNLRSLGRNADSLKLYHNILRPRYPNDDRRTLIFRSYRLRSPAYALLMREEYELLGGRLLEGVKRSLKYISMHARSFNPKDAYSTIKVAEVILSMLPRERFEAIATIERLCLYAEKLDYYVKDMARAEDLVRSYLTESLEVVKKEQRRRQEESLRAEKLRRQQLVAGDLASISESPWHSMGISTERQELGGRRSRAGRQVFIDLESLRFSAADLARIQIPPMFTKLEDKTLAFCFKYWPLIHDDSFERTLFLYSRKNRTKHYEVFSLIKQGRSADRSDEEILNAVLQTLITGYYYSIQGDIYMQQAWRTLRARLDESEIDRDFVGEIDAEPKKPVATKKKVAAKKKVASKKTAAKKTVSTEKVVEKSVLPKMAAPAKKTPVKKAVPAKQAVEKAAPATKKISLSKKIAEKTAPATKKALAKKVAEKTAPATKKAAPVKKVAKKATPPVKKAAPAKKAVPAPKKAVPIKKIAAVAKQESATVTHSLASLNDKNIPALGKGPLADGSKSILGEAAKAPPKRRPRKVAAPKRISTRTAPPPKKKAPGSVSDRLKELSGRSYDIYQERFLAKVRLSIRAVLLRQVSRSRRLFTTLPQEIEDLVYRFLRDHYNDPYMNWEESEEKNIIAERGWDLDSVDPIIEDCFRRL